jgi:ribosome biogenesis GTPase
MKKDAERRRRKSEKKGKRPRRHGGQSSRREHWREWLDEDMWEGHGGRERIMPRGERERQRRVEQLTRADADPEPAEEPILSDELCGRVTEVSQGLCRVRVTGAVVLCTLRGSLTAEQGGYTNVVAVGDRVAISRDGDERGVVEQVLPRRNQIARPDPFLSHLRQVLVANVDQLMIVASWRDPQLWPELIDRYMITAERNDAEPVIAVNKIDLGESREEIEEAVAPYRALGTQVLLTSATRGDGVDTLRARLAGRTTVLTGLSGVGKSALLSAVAPGVELRTGRVNEETHQGRHTTSQALMVELDDETLVVDTPGIREFGLLGLRQAELIGHYPELARAGRRCRFSDCSHDHEPGCAVQEAVDRGRISAVRYDSYLKIRATLPT